MRYSELELEGLTMGVLGFGGTGRHLARRAVAFGMNVQAMDLYPVSPSRRRGQRRRPRSARRHRRHQ